MGREMRSFDWTYLTEFFSERNTEEQPEVVIFRDGAPTSAFH